MIPTHGETEIEAAMTEMGAFAAHLLPSIHSRSAAHDGHLTVTEVSHWFDQ